jgi:geranylgeranyl diphosphate synthase, type II
MTTPLQNFIYQYRPLIEGQLLEHLPVSQQRGTPRFNEALHYALFPGGKRWRPMLTLLGGKLVGVLPEHIYPAACAIEYLHTSSMIIDDLPAMDDADLRRGKSAMHLAYDESTAMLVSLALMNHSYALLATTCQRANQGMSTGRLIAQAAEWIGSDGMIGGQVIDLELRGGSSGRDKLCSRNLKTTALMRLMMTTGAIALNAYEEEVQALSRFGEALGTAYQIYDDLLDELGETRVIGKTLKQDQRHLCPTYVSEYGVGEAQKMAVKILEEGNEVLLDQFGDCPEVELLIEAAQLIISAHSMTLQSNKYEWVAVH